MTACARPKVHYAGFKLFLLQAFGGICGHDHGFDAKLLKAFRENAAGSLFQIDHGDPGGRFFSLGNGGQSGTEGAIHKG